MTLPYGSTRPLAVSKDRKHGNQIRRPYLISLLQKDLIVFTERRTEDNTRYALEAVYPLLPFTPLTTHIEHMDR